MLEFEYNPWKVNNNLVFHQHSHSLIKNLLSLVSKLENIEIIMINSYNQSEYDQIK